MNLEKGTSFSLAATVLPTDATNKTVTWSSSNTAVATVQNGVVTGVKCGSAAIIATATDGSGVIASCSVAVIISVTSISLERSTLSLKKGRSTNIGKTVCPENASNKQVSWSSNNPDVASVGVHNGTIFANKAGQATIKATAKDGSGVYDTCVVTVEPEIMVESITLEPNISSINLWPNMNMTFSACVCPTNADCKTVSWESSDVEVVEIDAATGKVTAKKLGTAVIKARAQDGSGVTASCTIKVVQTATSSRVETTTKPTQTSSKNVPIDVSSGAHLLQHTIMPMFGGKNLKLTIHYNSTNLASGSMGVGWYHNFDKRLVVDTNNCKAYIYTGPTCLEYKSTNCDGTEFVCTGKGKEHYGMGYDCETGNYIVRYGMDSTECYDESGHLISQFDHQQYTTVFSYTDTCITITDKVTGKKIYLDRSECGRISSVRDDTGREASFTYDAHNRIVGIRDVNGNGKVVASL